MPGSRQAPPRLEAWWGLWVTEKRLGVQKLIERGLIDMKNPQENIVLPSVLNKWQKKVISEPLDHRPSTQVIAKRIVSFLSPFKPQSCPWLALEAKGGPQGAVLNGKESTAWETLPRLF